MAEQDNQSPERDVAAETPRQPREPEEAVRALEEVQELLRRHRHDRR